MTKQPFALIRADAAPQTGGGHVQRCLALAETMTAQGWHCGFAFRDGTLETVPALAESGHRLTLLDCPEEEEADYMAGQLDSGCDLAVIDHYHRDASFETACRAFATRILALEDRPTRPHDCDFLLDPTPGRKALDYQGLVSDGCEPLLGPEYALLRRQFSEARADTLARREKGAAVQKVLVSIGMTDPSNITTIVLQAIAQSGIEVAVDVILGSVAPHLQSVKQLAEALPLDIQVHTDVDNMAAFMSAADLAIGASGSTVLERCCLGLPGIAIVIAENQRHLADAFISLKVAEVIEANDVDAPAIAAILTRLWTNENARTQMSCAGAALCDGLGARRVVGALS